MPEQVVPMFPRGKGPLVSVMIASRGRPACLEKTVRSFYDLADDKKSVEFIVKADTDDAETQDAVMRLCRELPCTVLLLTTPRGRGFFEMDKWVNHMCASTRGDWLVLFNDDARVTTRGWDAVLAGAAVRAPLLGFHRLTLFLFRENGRPDSFSFPCVRRGAYEVLGHFSPMLACDAYIRRVLGSVCAVTNAPVDVEHDRAPHAGDDTHGGIVGANALMNWQCSSVWGLRHYADAVGKLVAWLESYDAGLDWADRPRGDGWHWFKLGRTGSLEHLAYVRGATAFVMGNASDGAPCLTAPSNMVGLWARAWGDEKD